MALGLYSEDYSYSFRQSNISYALWCVKIHVSPQMYPIHSQLKPVHIQKRGSLKYISILLYSYLHLGLTNRTQPVKILYNFLIRQRIYDAN